MAIRERGIRGHPDEPNWPPSSAFGAIALLALLLAGGIAMLVITASRVESPGDLPRDVRFNTVEVEGRMCIVATYHLSVAIDCEEAR